MNATLAADWNAVISAFNLRLDRLKLGYTRLTPLPAGYHIDAAYVHDLTARLLALLDFYVDPDEPFVLSDFHELFQEYDAPIGQYPSDFQYLRATYPLTAGYRTLRTGYSAGWTLEQLTPWLTAAADLLDKMHLVPVGYPSESPIVTATTVSKGGTGTWYRDTGELVLTEDFTTVPAAALSDALTYLGAHPAADYSGGCGHGQTLHIHPLSNDSVGWTSYALTSDRTYTTFSGTPLPCTILVAHALMPGTDYYSSYPIWHNYPSPLPYPYPADITPALTASGYLDFDVNGHVITAYTYAIRSLGTYAPGLTYGLDAPLFPTSTLTDDVLTTFDPSNPYAVSEWSLGWHTSGNTHGSFSPLFLIDFS